MKRSLLGLTSMMLAWNLVNTALAQPPAKPVPADVVKLNKDSHLVAWWKFDETDGKSATDSSSRDRKGSLTGTLAFDTASVAGRVGKALYQPANILPVFQ